MEDFVMPRGVKELVTQEGHICDTLTEILSIYACIYYMVIDFVIDVCCFLMYVLWFTLELDVMCQNSSMYDIETEIANHKGDQLGAYKR